MKAIYKLSLEVNGNGVEKDTYRYLVLSETADNLIIHRFPEEVLVEEYRFPKGTLLEAMADRVQADYKEKKLAVGTSRLVAKSSLGKVIMDTSSTGITATATFENAEQEPALVKEALKKFKTSAEKNISYWEKIQSRVNQACNPEPPLSLDGDVQLTMSQALCVLEFISKNRFVQDPDDFGVDNLTTGQKDVDLCVADPDHKFGLYGYVTQGDCIYTIEDILSMVFGD